MCPVASGSLWGPYLETGAWSLTGAPRRFQGDSRLEHPGCYHHCVDENIERRNHYLDLAGIENYTSQFGPGKGRQPWAGPQRGVAGQAGRTMSRGGHFPRALWGEAAFPGQIKDSVWGR